jgi:hypothetical protein
MNNKKIKIKKNLDKEKKKKRNCTIQKEMAQHFSEKENCQPESLVTISLRNEEDRNTWEKFGSFLPN